MIKVEISDETVHVKQGISGRTQKPYMIREQEGWGFFYAVDGRPHPHPQRVRLTLEDEQAPYPKGLYVLAPESLFVDRWGQVSIRAKLRPAAVKSVQQAA
ncbi:G5P family DNA-binding protein [Thauera sp. Sel9]|uniref:G5P family DNA-binding protein n=1 Tax=Thauera sp. Sel9 TaxID=2974299 RepID=UPI0021E108B3|nr:G5P family DNA-binding protein [Thauera sp. Sel9]MCV2216862.1 G5P family DNA-binding protein [Thauera sp. Sel9]